MARMCTPGERDEKFGRHSLRVTEKRGSLIFHDDRN